MAITIAEVETAITAIQTGGQTVSVDGFSYSQANLDSLLRLRDTLANESLRSSTARPLFRGFKFTTMGYSE